MKLYFFSGYSIIIRSMKKVKHILATFLHCVIPQDNYYPKLIHTPFQFSVKYYIVVISFLALLFMGIAGLHCTPIKMYEYKQSLIQTLSVFPQDVSMTIARGLLESNQVRPSFFWVHHNNQPRLVFMVYTKDQPDTSNIPLPLIFFGRDHMRFAYHGYNMVRPYDPMLSADISTSTVDRYIADINAKFPTFLVVFYFFFALVVPLLFVGVSTLFILICSGVVFILLRTFIPHIHLKKCIQAGLHGTHIPLLITIFLYSLFPRSTNIMVISIALIFVFTLVSTYEMYSREVAHFKGL